MVPEPCEPASDVEDIYDAALRHAVLVIPLLPTVFDRSMAAAFELNVDSLIFLEGIREFASRTFEDPSQDLNFAVEVAFGGRRKDDFEGGAATVKVTDVRFSRRAEEAERHATVRSSTRRAIGPDERRSDKADWIEHADLDLQFRWRPRDPLRLYDRIRYRYGPLPIGLNAQFDPDSARSTLQPEQLEHRALRRSRTPGSWAALKGFSEGRASSWSHVPLPGRRLMTEKAGRRDKSGCSSRIARAIYASRCLSAPTRIRRPWRHRLRARGSRSAADGGRRRAATGRTVSRCLAPGRDAHGRWRSPRRTRRSRGCRSHRRARGGQSARWSVRDGASHSRRWRSAMG